jgi:hypothetical protein
MSLFCSFSPFVMGKLFLRKVKFYLRNVSKGHYIEGFPEPVQLRFLSVERRAQPEWEQ